MEFKGTKEELNMVRPDHKKDIQEWLWQLCFNIDKVSRKYSISTIGVGIHANLENYTDKMWDGSFKIYHSKGYCIDISKEFGDTFDDVEFSTYEEYDGFEKIGDGAWLKILTYLCEDVKSSAYFKIFKPLN